MAKPSSPHQAFDQGRQSRGLHPLKLTGNHHKFLESINNLKEILFMARDALSYELEPQKGNPDMLLGGGYLCLARERHRVVKQILRETLAKELGYNTLPALELLQRPDLLKKLTSEVLRNTLPAAAAVLPPSIHPDTGMPYQWDGAGDWRNLPTIPDALLICWQGELSLRRTSANDTGLSVGRSRFEDSKIDNSSLMLALDFPPSNADLVADQCNIIGEMRATAGQHQTEPEWRACLGVLLHTTQGEAVCHQWSQGHTGYSSAETNRKLDGLERFGPTTCDILGLYRPNACRVCPHRGKIKSPIALGVARPSASTVMPAGGLVANAGLIALPHVMPAAKAMEMTNKYFGYTPDWGERGTYFRRDPQGFPFPCSKDELANVMANRSVQLDNGAHVPLFKFWNGHSARNEVSRVVYAPGCGSVDEYGTPILNLYQGLSRKPREGRWTLMRSHLLKVICRGNLELYRYLLGWMAHKRRGFGDRSTSTTFCSGRC